MKRFLLWTLLASLTSWCAPGAKLQIDYFLDDCRPEKIIGRGGLGDLWVANAFTARDGGEVIVSIEASFDFTPGWPLGVHLYDDPDDDLVPDDLVLLQSVQTTFPARGACHEFPIPPTEVSGVFFVALSYADHVGGTDYPLLLDITTDRHRTWYVETSSPGSLDPAHLPSPILRQSDVPGYGGQYLLRATGVPRPVSILGVECGEVAGELELEWASAPGAFYQILKANDLGLGDWAVLDPDRVPAGGADGPASTSRAPVEGNAACYRVRRTTAPAIFEEDFEHGAAGWVVDRADPGHPTKWELGSLQAGPFSAHSGTQAYGTMLGGNYADNALTTLRSPLIDLADVESAKLGFWYIGDFGDFHGNDHGKVEILDGSEVPLLEGSMSGLSTWFWTQREMVLPDSAYGGPIYLRFTLDDYNDGYIGRGLYIDSVYVRATEPGLVGYWRMGESATWDGTNWTIPDQASSPADGISVGLLEADRVTGAPIASGDPGYCMDFHSLSHVAIGTPDKLNLTESLTVTAWVKPSGVVTPGAHDRQQPIIGKGDFQFMLRYNRWGQDFEFFTHDSIGWHQVGASAGPSTPSTFPGGAWYFVVGRVDGSAAYNNLSIFVDGELGGQATAGITIDGAPLMIGRNSSHMDRVFNGFIDEVRIYDYALSEAEIQALYAERIDP